MQLVEIEARSEPEHTRVLELESVSKVQEKSSTMWIVVLGIWVVVVGFFQYVKFVQKNAFAKHLPLLNPSYPLLGNGLMFFGKPDHEKFQNLRKLTSIEYPLTRFFLGPRVMVGTTEPEIAQQVLTDPVWMDKPFIYEFFELPFGLLTSKCELNS